MGEVLYSFYFTRSCQRINHTGKTSSRRALPFGRGEQDNTVFEVEDVLPGTCIGMKGLGS